MPKSNGGKPEKGIKLQQSLWTRETLEAQISFERYAKKTISRSEETKEDHLQTQREEVEDQVQTQEDQELEMAEGKKELTEVEGQAKSGLQ